MKKHFLAFIILSLFLSCSKKCADEEGKLTSEELSWISYSGWETLIFKSNHNEFDTLSVDPISTYNTPVSQGGSGSCNPKQESKYCRVSGPFPILMILTSYHKNEFSPDGKASISTNNSVFNFSDSSPQNNVMINNSAYNNVYIMKADTTNFTSSNIWCIYYTKLNGILRYDLTGGEIWEKIN